MATLAVVHASTSLPATLLPTIAWRNPSIPKRLQLSYNWNVACHRAFTSNAMVIAHIRSARAMRIPNENWDNLVMWAATNTPGYQTNKMKALSSAVKAEKNLWKISEKFMCGTENLLEAAERVEQRMHDMLADAFLRIDFQTYSELLGTVSAQIQKSLYAQFSDAVLDYSSFALDFSTKGMLFDLKADHLFRVYALLPAKTEF